MPINIDGEHIASTANGTFVAIPLELKKYSIQAGGPIGAPAAQYKKEFPARVITPKSGDLYFIRQEIKMIPYSRTAPQFMMLQTGGSPIPIAMGGGSIAGCYTFHADNKTGKLECSKLRQVRADFSE